MNASTIALIFSVLFGISEALALIPQVNSNSIFQLIFSVLKTLAGNKTP